MNKDARSEIKLKDRSYHCYLRTNDWHLQSAEINQNEHVEKPQLSIKSLKLILKHFLIYASSKLHYSQTIPDLKDGNKIISDNCETAKIFNMYFTSVFTEEIDTLPQFHTPSENTIDWISFTVDKVQSELK